MVFCYWLFLYPFIVVVREITQLFLWTGDYFTERIAITGGLAQYLSNNYQTNGLDYSLLL